jgi:hypothetical protein
MPYTVQFVGLVCFLRERGGRLALLPDGREPGEGIDPHYGSIVVAPKSVQKTDGWDGVKGVGPGTFPLDGCDVVIQDADTPGTLDTTDHVLPQLREINSNFKIDPARAKTVAKVRIRQGTLKARLVPGGTALISQLDVPHDGSIEIKVRLDNGLGERTITLAPGTEIAVTNMARGNMYRQKRRRVPASGTDHFKIYEKLSADRVTLTNPVTVPAVSESNSRHVLFSRRGAISLYSDCSNTGCC